MPEEPIAVSVARSANTFWDTDYYYYHPSTLAPLDASGYVWGALKDADSADLLRRMNYDIHTGAILGLPGKVLMFLTSLMIASLPVTGVLFWWGKHRKPKKRT